MSVKAGQAHTQLRRCLAPGRRGLARGARWPGAGRPSWAGLPRRAWRLVRQAARESLRRQAGYRVARHRGLPGDRLTTATQRGGSGRGGALAREAPMLPRTPDGLVRRRSAPILGASGSWRESAPPPPGRACGGRARSRRRLWFAPRYAPRSWLSVLWSVRNSAGAGTLRRGRACARAQHRPRSRGSGRDRTAFRRTWDPRPGCLVRSPARDSRGGVPARARNACAMAAVRDRPLARPRSTSAAGRIGFPVRRCPLEVRCGRGRP